jgi:hypothetical protein
MALKFGDSKGGAQKKKLDSYDYVNGRNTLRIVGEILARYVYWIEGENGKKIPFENLSFDRNEEAFNNKEPDHVKEYHPSMKSTWSYATQCIVDGKIKVVNLKKKLFEQIINVADDLGDPTDPVDGWDIVFKREKTGPQVYNVEYTLEPFKCKKRPLDEADMELLKTLKPIDEVMPRPTPEAQKDLLERLSGAKNENEDPEATEEFDVT